MLRSNKVLIFKTLALLMVFLSFSTRAEGHQKAVKGITDLRGEKIDDRYIINLSGEWEFYYLKMLYPIDFREDEKIPEPFFGKVPSYWTEYRTKAGRPNGKGFATYRLRIILPESTKMRLGLSVPVFDSAYDLWIDGKLVSSNGIPGKDEETTKPEYAPGFRVITNTSDTVELVINVSNYQHRRGGFWLPMKFGSFQAVQKTAASKWALSYASVVLLVGFGLFFLIFFILYPKDRRMAYFTIAIIGLAMRPLFTGEFLINDLTKFEWGTIVKLEYFSLFLILGGWVWFIRLLYPSTVIRYASITVTVFLAASALAVLLFTPDIFGYTVLAYYFVTLFLIAYSMVMSLSGMLRGKILDTVYFISFALLTVAAVNDILVSLGKSTGTGYVMAYVVMGFIFIQSVLLLYNWIDAYNQKEKLQAELEYMNKNLELMVNTRTQELILRNEEIGKQNSMIAEQNRQLSETIQLKNKVFSVISHDLRSPVVNILYMLNLLKEEEYKEKYDSFANTSIEYAQMVINLLENMLVWGRGQEDKIKFSPGKHDLASVILTNMSILKDGADRKEISVNFTQKGNSLAWFDKDLIDIVIRNLLSNALKYTRRGGRISILVKDSSSENNRMIIKICDNGVGIPQDKLSRLFASAEIETTLGTENEKGTGLGLKLCHELVKINKGEISVESTPGEGTCFSIEIPSMQKHED